MPPRMRQKHELLITFPHDCHPMGAAFEIFSPGFKELAARIKNDHRVFRVGVDKNPPASVDDDAAVGVTELHPFRKLAPAFHPLILVSAAAENGSPFCAAGAGRRRS